MSSPVSSGFFAPTFLLVWIFFQGIGAGFAASVNLAWNPNAETDLIGYRLYWGTAPRRYDHFMDAGLVTQGTVPDLAERVTYYFAATARNSAGLESVPSAEVSYRIPGPAGSGGGSAPGEIEVAPTASSTSVELAEDSEVEVFLSASSASGGGLTYAIVSPPQNGTLSGVPPNMIYRPRRDFYGEDAFEFRVNDGALDSAVAYVDVVVIPVNDAPVGVNLAVLAQEDGAAPVALRGYDVDGDAVSFVITKPPANGKLEGKMPNLVYRPSPNYNGSDYLEYTTSDGILASPIARISFVISPVEDPPTAIAQTISLLEDSKLNLVLAGVDPEGRTLTYSIARPPSKGLLIGIPPLVLYIPTLGFKGSDGFDFRVTDTAGLSSVATVQISILPVNLAPTANPISVSVSEDLTASITLSGEDPEGSKLMFAIASPPRQGVLTGTPPILRYRPSADYFGTDYFDYTVSDGVRTSEPARVSIVISAVNDAPSAQALTALVPKNGSTPLLLSGADQEGSALTFTVSSLPSQGTLTGIAPSLIYRPAANFVGSDSFRYTVSDGVLSSAGALVSISVSDVNTVPTAMAQSLTLAEDSSIAVRLAGQDVDGDTLSFSIVGSPANGTLSGKAPNLSYTPKANFAGSDSFEFTARDGAAVSAPKVVSLTVTPVNDAPTATAQSLTLAEDSSIAVRLSGQDVDGDTLAYSIARSPLNGTIAGAPPNVTYTPNPNFAGEDSFEFLARDRTLASAPGLVSLTVVAANSAPVATARTVSGLEDSLIPITLSGTDADGDSLTYSVVVQPSQGALLGTAPNFVYRPNEDWTGTDSIEFIVHDGTRPSASAVLTINVTPVNDAPRANAQNVVTGYGMPLSITLTGSDPEGSPLTYRIERPPVGGILTGKSPNLVYRAKLGYSGLDSFTVVARDGALDSLPATIQVRISLILLASNRGTSIPVATETTGGGAGDEAGDGMIGDGMLGDGMVGTAGTTTPTVPEASVEWLSLPSHGIVGNLEDGQLSYEPALDGSTLDSFTFRLNTADGPSEPMSIALHLVRFQEVKRTVGQVEVSFPTIAGLTYRLEWNDQSPSYASTWEVLHEVTPAEPGIVTLAVPNPPNDVFRFIRLTCEGTESKVASEAWAISSPQVAAGIDGRVYSVPFQGPIRLRGRVASLTGNSVEIHSGTTEFPDVSPVGGQVTHALLVRSSRPEAQSSGIWWPITGQSAQQIQMDEGVEPIAGHLLAGDEVEILRLMTVAEVFGKASSPEIQINDGDRVKISGLAGEDYLIEYRVSNRGGASYWWVQGDVIAGPFDGTTLPLPPFPTFYFVDRVTPGSLVLVGRVQEGPAVQYLQPGARMIGNSFPVAMEVPELSAYRLVEGDYPWDESEAGTAPEICPQWAASSGVIGAGEGLWIRVPEGSGSLRWMQQCPWPSP